MKGLRVLELSEALNVDSAELQYLKQIMETNIILNDIFLYKIIFYLISLIIDTKVE